MLWEKEKALETISNAMSIKKAKIQAKSLKKEKINQHFPQTLSKYFYSKPNALKSNIMDVESVDGMNKHIIEKIKRIKINDEAKVAATGCTVIYNHTHEHTLTLMYDTHVHTHSHAPTYARIYTKRRYGAISM